MLWKICFVKNGDADGGVRVIMKELNEKVVEVGRLGESDGSCVGL